MVKVLTSFTKFTTGEGERITYTFSEVSNDGRLLSQNKKENFIAVDEELQKHIAAIDKYISDKYLTEEEN